nr:porin PorA family protein [Aeromicrobium wangtongii]
MRARDALVGVTAFALVMAAMLYVLAEQRFAGSWPTADRTVVATADDASYLDLVDGTQRQATLKRQRTVRRTFSTVPGADAVLVSTNTVTADGDVVSRQRWTAAQRRFTGSAVDSTANVEKFASFNESGDAVEEDRQLRGVRGILVRFPRDTQPVTYRRWDPETRQTGEAVFLRTERLHGAEVLVFRQVEKASTDADGTSTRSDTTLWVRPEVGGVVKTASHVVVRASADGQPTLDARFVDSASSVRQASRDVDREMVRQRVRSTVLPGMAVLVGILAGVATVIMGRPGGFSWRRRRARQ